MNYPILGAVIASERDVVSTRQRARDLAALLGFEPQDQTRIATAISEIARNAFRYAGGGRAEYALEGDNTPQTLVVTIADQGPGIAHLKRVLDGQYISKTGLGIGILGARRLMDEFEIDSAGKSGTRVVLKKRLPSRAPPVTSQRLAKISDELARQTPQDPLDELQRQNQELLRALQELRSRQEEMEQLNHELEDTNRGVLALYAELDERADRLKRADQMKSQFLSHMSHEFRTPLNSILALCRLLLDRRDGQLTPEQEKQVTYIRQSAENLFELVNDLLDLAKVEAGKTEVKAAEFEVVSLFGALRGVLRPLLTNPAVSLIFEDPAGIPSMFTDEGKLSQILRNFISNALKFTDRGEVRVSAQYSEHAQTVTFAVCDTGIGIAPEHHDVIFRDFAQIENPVQRRVKGTGLGLSLSKKLAELLGGGVALSSEPGVGSTFSVWLPMVYSGAEPRVREGEGRRTPRLLSIEDEEVSRYVIRQALSSLRVELIEAATAADGLRRAREERPDLILLDLLMPEMNGFEVLQELRRSESTRGIPVIVVTSKLLTPSDRKLLDEHGALLLPKDVFSRADGGETVQGALARAGISDVTNTAEGGAHEAAR
jgi:signal transduction histidine kinase